MLSIVGTPIGNLGDLSPRAADTLRRANLILCEDTRVTSKLLAHLGVHVALMRADENVLSRRLQGVLSRVAGGERIAFVSDAGMPGVSDPGQRLVDAALDAGLPLEVVPGPSAVICALVASGLPMARFFFEGFLPRKAAALNARLCELAAVPATLVIFESPRRTVATLAAIALVFPQRKVALVRELTKVHEEVLRGSASELASALEARDVLRGECVIVIGAPSDDEAPACSEALPPLADAISAALAEGEPKSALARRLSKAYQLPRSDVYDQILELAPRSS